MTDAPPPQSPLALIVAVARNGVIGNRGDLPWRIREDMKHFKDTTWGHTVIMGRRTHESIGRALPSRRNIVISRNPGARFEGCETVASLDEALALARATETTPFVIGGASLYEEALPLATEIHLTRIDRDVEGDTFLELDLTDFEEVASHEGTSEGVTFHHLVRREV